MITGKKKEWQKEQIGQIGLLQSFKKPLRKRMANIGQTIAGNEEKQRISEQSAKTKEREPVRIQRAEMAVGNHQGSDAP